VTHVTESQRVTKSALIAAAQSERKVPESKRVQHYAAESSVVHRLNFHACIEPHGFFLG